VSDPGDFAQDLKLFGTRRARLRLAAAVVALGVLPFVASPFLLDLANQVLLACIGALALMLLTGFAGLNIARHRRPARGRRLYGAARPSG